MESTLPGLVLDSSVLIAAERRKLTPEQAIETYGRPQEKSPSFSVRSPSPRSATASIAPARRRSATGAGQPSMNRKPRYRRACATAAGELLEDRIDCRLTELLKSLASFLKKPATASEKILHGPQRGMAWGDGSPFIRCQPGRSADRFSPSERRLERT